MQAWLYPSGGHPHTPDLGQSRLCLSSLRATPTRPHAKACLSAPGQAWPGTLPCSVALSSCVPQHPAGGAPAPAAGNVNPDHECGYSAPPLRTASSATLPRTSHTDLPLGVLLRLTVPVVQRANARLPSYRANHDECSSGIKVVTCYLGNASLPGQEARLRPARQSPCHSQASRRKRLTSSTLTLRTTTAGFARLSG